MVKLCRKMAGSSWFQNFITGVIVFAAILVGIETYPHMAGAYHTPIHWLNQIILGIFILEILVKMAAESPKPWNYFRDPWNDFDFFIVAACFIPGAGQYAIVLRLLRLLRVLKLLNAIPKLQILVGALLKSIPSMFYVSLLLFLLFYVYAVAAVFLFGITPEGGPGNDPLHFGNLQTSLLSLFRAVTLEDWTDIMYIQMYGCMEYPFPSLPNGPVCTEETAQANWWLGFGFFVSFVLLGTMIILNLFIGVIMNGMEEAQAEAEEITEAARREERGEDVATVEHDVFEIAQQLETLQERVALLKIKLRDHAG